MTQPRILIAGATGANGRQLTEELVAKGLPVRALVRNKDKAAQVLPQAAELVEGDLSVSDSLTTALDKVGKAYVVTSIQPDTVSLFQNFFDAAKVAKVSQLVKFSGLGAAPEAPSEVIRQHAASDAALRESGVPYTILRPNSFHQNMLWQAESIASTGAFHLPLADAAQSTIDVRDIAEITSTILTTEGHLGKAYDLTGTESLTFHDVAEIIADVRGAPVQYVPVSPEAAEDAMRRQGMPEWQAQVLAEIQALFATGRYADVTQDAENLLGRAPRSFRTFAEDHKSFFVAKA
ncbi:MAG: SDR family oxidoreductase [Pseudomonadota bacterium]